MSKVEQGVAKPNKLDLRGETAPVVLFVYNRPEHTRLTLEALSRNELAAVSHLFVFSDAPRTREDASFVAQVREIVRTAAESSWFRRVDVEEAQSNRGLARSIIRGVSRVLNEHSSVIVLEDDLVTSVDFLSYMNGALEYYSSIDSVGSVTAYNPLPSLPSDYRLDVYLSPRNCSWGWGTWGDRWAQVDWDVGEFPKLRDNVKLRREFNATGCDRYRRLSRQMKANHESWSVRFGFWQFMNGRFTVYPARNRVRNIGLDGSGVHSKRADRFDRLILNEATPSRFTLLAADSRILKQMYELYSGGMKSRIHTALLEYWWPEGVGFAGQIARRLWSHTRPKRKR